MELVVSTGVGALVFLVSAVALSNLYRDKSRADFLLALSEIRVTFQNAVIRSQDWSTTLAHNSHMACFAGSAPSKCAALATMKPEPLKLYANGALLYDSGDAKSGYTRGGVACSSYGATPDCVLKPILKWSAQCHLAVDPDCESPLIILDLTYDGSIPDFKGINFASYGFRLSKATFQLEAKNPCGGPIPSCTSSQAAICEAGSWVCREFGTGTVVAAATPPPTSPSTPPTPTPTPATALWACQGGVTIVPFYGANPFGHCENRTTGICIMKDGGGYWKQMPSCSSDDNFYSGDLYPAYGGPQPKNCVSTSGPPIPDGLGNTFTTEDCE